MTIRELVAAFGLEIVAGDDHLENEVTGGYASDLLSCVMAGAKPGNIWVTLQAHPNVIAVAELLDLAGVIITEGMRPDAESLARAKERGIPTLLTRESTFTVVGRLVQSGVSGAK